jgi:phosphoribosylamine--glycine ligase
VKVLIVGSGGREHALAWALARSGRLSELHAAPGNPGIAALATCHPARADDPASLVPLAGELRVDLVVVGPEAPLVAGLADHLRRRGISVFGPGAEAAQIEGSKAFAKDVMEAAGVPTARTLAVARPPCVVKADGLAAGKGVWVSRTQAELDAGLRAAETLRTTSASTTTTRARTQEAWARTHRCRGSRTTTSRSSSTSPARRSCGSSRSGESRSSACSLRD